MARTSFLLINVVLGTFVLSSISGASGNCVDGQTCYCDRVKGGDLADPSVLLCEDFESPMLHDDVSVGGVGPWYNDGTYTNARGAYSYWTRTYGPSVSECAWTSGEPVSPKRGKTCGYSTCYPKEWRVDNLWDGNNGACIDIVANGEFDDEIPTNAEPFGPGGARGVFDGRQSLAHRVQAGRTSGIIGTGTFNGSYRTIGVTMALAYPTNSAAADLWRYPWKHNEWATAAEQRGDGPFLFHNTNALSEDDPFQMFMFIARDSSQAACETAFANAQVRRGAVSCNSVALYYRADPAYYKRSRDFPSGTWGCAQGYFENLGSTNTKIQVWFNGTLIVDIQNLDSRFLSARDGYTALSWNNYANRNQTSDLSTQTTYRYEDNLHVRAGAPVSCEQIGFSNPGSNPAPPAAPVLLR
jgi:hypothetical protein